MENNVKVTDNQINKTQELDEKGPKIWGGILSALSNIFAAEKNELSQEEEIANYSKLSKEDVQALLDSIKKADKIVKPTDSGIVIKRPLKDDTAHLQRHARIATREAFERQNLKENTAIPKKQDNNEKIIGE